MAGGNYGNYNTTGVLKGPSGPSAVKAEEASPEIVVTAQQLSKLDALQMLLDVIGLVPGFGAPADILNAIISGARGDWLGAALSLFGAVPVAGEAATAGKIAKNADRYAAAVAKVADEVLPHLPASVQAQLRPAIEAAKKKIDELGGKKPEPEPGSPPKAKEEGTDGKKTKPDPCKPLENGVPGEGYREGKHGKIKKGGASYKPPRESHHMPADAAYDTFGGRPIASDAKPAIQMDKADHQASASWGNGAAAQQYRKTQSALLKSGKSGYLQAVMMDIADIRAKFGDKYDGAIAQYFAWAKCKGFI
jgi:hypothetical protein